MHMLVAAGLAATLVSMGTEAGTGGDTARPGRAGARGPRRRLPRRAGRAARAWRTPPEATRLRPLRRRRPTGRASRCGVEPSTASTSTYALRPAERPGGAVASFGAALERRPDWVEPKIGASGCLMAFSSWPGRRGLASSAGGRVRPLWAEQGPRERTTHECSGSWGECSSERPHPGPGMRRRPSPRCARRSRRRQPRRWRLRPTPRSHRARARRRT